VICFEPLPATIEAIEHNLPLPTLIKIDIEGGEIEMLEGSRDVLGKCRRILLFELHGTNEAVDRTLREVWYRSYVLGESRSMVQASWDAFVIGATSEDVGKCESACALAKGARLRR
jgi:hypothetical protein